MIVSSIFDGPMLGAPDETQNSPTLPVLYPYLRLIRFHGHNHFIGVLGLLKKERELFLGPTLASLRFIYVTVQYP